MQMQHLQIGTMIIKCPEYGGVLISEVQVSEVPGTIFKGTNNKVIQNVKNCFFNAKAMYKSNVN